MIKKRPAATGGFLQHAMGRRILPKIDRTVAIDRHFLELDDLQPGFTVDQCFSSAGPVEVEVGSGKGLFLLEQSGANPNRRFVGIEIAKKYGRFAAYRLAKHDRPNAVLIRGDALRFFDAFLSDESILAVHVYFPDPWWKARHRRRRVIQEGFIHDVQRVLEPGGLLHFWTDVEEYFESTCQTIAACSDLAGPQTVSQRPAEHEMDFHTHFERRMRLNDQPVFRAQFCKADTRNIGRAVAHS